MLITKDDQKTFNIMIEELKYNSDNNTDMALIIADFLEERDLFLRAKFFKLYNKFFRHDINSSWQWIWTRFYPGFKKNFESDPRISFYIFTFEFNRYFEFIVPVDLTSHAAVCLMNVGASVHRHNCLVRRLNVFHDLNEIWSKPFRVVNEPFHNTKIYPWMLKEFSGFVDCLLKSNAKKRKPFPFGYFKDKKIRVVHSD